MRIITIPLTALVLFAASGFAQAQQVRYPQRPGERDFILDEADLITDADEATIKEACDKLLTEKAVPIIIVTINSMADYGATGWQIERYARNLFDEWAIGYKKWNHGILLLVSKGDRKARIEFGADWAGRKNNEAMQIMDDWIIANFKKGEFSTGILKGVEGLDALARELKIPKPPTPIWVYLIWIGFFALAIFTVVSLIRRRASGWAWIMWGGIFMLGGFLLISMLRSRGGGGGFGGGSFGGGFGGGGGATGSW